MFLDTSGLVCVFDEGDSRHSEAVTLYGKNRQSFTHNYVLAEFIPLCQTRGLNRAKALIFVFNLLDNSLVDVVWVNESLHRAAFALLQARRDKTYSLCDALSFHLMQQRTISQALTTDRHFSQEGFLRLLPL